MVRCFICFVRVLVRWVVGFDVVRCMGRLCLVSLMVIVVVSVVLLMLFLFMIMMSLCLGLVRLFISWVSVGVDRGVVGLMFVFEFGDCLLKNCCSVFSFIRLNVLSGIWFIGSLWRMGGMVVRVVCL